MGLGFILTIIEYFVPVIFEKFVDLIINHWDADPDLQVALENLKINMQKAHMVIPRIRVDSDYVLLEMLKELKETTYEAEDQLDELNYLRLKKQVEEDDNVDNYSSHSKRRKVGKYISKLKNIDIFSKKKHGGNSEPSSSNLFGGDVKSTVAIIDNIAEKLKRITSAVHMNANLLKKEERTQNLMESSLSDPRATTSLLPHDVLGREEERKRIIELLLNPPTSADATGSKNMMFLLPIVGIGGVGKTTLAQLVYNNEQVKRHFDVTMWVHVSNQFDVVRLTREMLEILGVPKSDLPTNLDSLQMRLKEKLSSQRFLLVLDDVWSSEWSNWEKLCAPLKSRKPGCRILMTTRLVTDVSIMDNEIRTMSPINLKGLLENEYWSLFEKCAFGGEDVGNHPKLEEIGRQIVKKLSGSPLAAKTMGGLLRVKLDVDHWQHILESDIWKLKQNIDDIMPALKLSYQHLPPYLQQCFAYCSVFPKGYRFDVDELVAMWIAQGYIQDKSSGRRKSLMDIGREYFHELKRMYFFEAFGIHDLLHDLAEFVSADECFRVDGTKQLKEIPRTVRHLFIRPDKIKMDDLKSLCNLKNLRTLIIKKDCKDDMATIEELFNEVKRVRVLYLDSIYGDEYVLLNKMGDMIHLRCIVANYLSKFPHSCSQLYQLQLLKYGRFTKRRSNPFVIGKLICLQELDQFCVGKEEGHGIGQLKNLRELRGSLELDCLENVASKTEALEARLNQKEHLLNLGLSWDDKMKTSPKVAEEVLEGLRPPPNIKVLRIIKYPGVKSPTWASGLTSLTELQLSNVAMKDKELSLFLQDFWINNNCLSGLCIWNCPKITTLPLVDGLHRPKALTELYISDCLELMSMVGLQAFVSIEWLCVKECPKLIISRSTTTCSGAVVLKDDTVDQEEEEAASTLRVRNLQIDDPALLTVLLKSTQSLHYLQSMEIQICELTYLNIEEEICLHLTALKELKISLCRNLESLQQAAYLKSLPSLEELYVYKCPKLQSLPLMPASLKTLSVTHCPSLRKGRYQEGGEDWHNIAHVNKIIWL